VLYGDVISGPLGPVFGLGVKDIPLDPQDIEPQGLWRTRFAHTHYWMDDRTDWDFVDTLNGAPNKTSGQRWPLRIRALLDALDLDRKSLECPENSSAAAAKPLPGGSFPS
jgi:hypothetical protein